MPTIRLSLDSLVDGIRSGDRFVLSRAITLVESTRPDDRRLASELLDQIIPHTGDSLRIGITGVPGVGKSTFIEVFGELVLREGRKLAVLAIDPTSQRSHGSIMGDKTRMETLAGHPDAYIRPAPTGLALGGVSNRTRESMLLCEAAGFDTIFIETVGVGQSETVVHGMVDFFLLLMLAGAGDELQGIKKGIMEMADALVITKADGDNQKSAAIAQEKYRQVVRFFPQQAGSWVPPVLTASSTEKTGLDKVWETILKYEDRMRQNGFFEYQRQQQNLEWMESLIDESLRELFVNHPAVNSRLQELKEEVISGKKAANMAKNELMELFLKKE